jgi:hypothetical protein
MYIYDHTLRNSSYNKKYFKVVSKTKTHFIPVMFLENHIIYEVMWKNTVEPKRPQKAFWRMGISP